MPELLTFAYIPAYHLKFNGTSQQPDPRKDVFSDYTGRPTQCDEDEHVLVLEMNDQMVRKSKRPPDSQVSLGSGLVL